jgi:uncharacterized membrane protein YjjB (DUF3815 family)
MWRLLPAFAVVGLGAGTYYLFLENAQAGLVYAAVGAAFVLGFVVSRALA